MVGSMPRALETNAGIATFLQNAEFFGLGSRLRPAASGAARQASRSRTCTAWPTAGSIPRRRRWSSRAHTTADGHVPSAILQFCNPAMIRAVLFDVDFTLIYPGPAFRGEGYQAFGQRHGMSLDPAALRPRGGQRGAAAGRARRSAIRRRALRAVHEAHHRADGRSRGRRSMPVPGRCTTSGPTVITSSSTTKCRPCWVPWRRRASGSALSRTRTGASKRSGSTSICEVSSPAGSLRRSTA